jgi:hypothetical protein
MQTNGSCAPKQRLIWALAILACLATVGRIAFDVYRRAGSMRTLTTAAATILVAKPGARVKAVVRIETPVGPNIYAAELLDSRDGADYHGTSIPIRVALAGDTVVVMGAVADIGPGAVIQVSGTTDEGHTLHAQTVVVLSGYVRIVPVQS